MFNYGDEIKLINDVIIKILGVFPPEKAYLVDINGIKKKIDSEFLDFLVDKYKVIETIDIKVEEFSDIDELSGMTIVNESENVGIKTKKKKKEK